MCAENSVVKSRAQLWQWGQAHLDQLVDYTRELQQEVGRLRDSAAQNSSNSSRPPSTDRPGAGPSQRSLDQPGSSPTG